MFDLIEELEQSGTLNHFYAASTPQSYNSTQLVWSRSQPRPVARRPR